VLKVLPESHLALSKAELRHDEEREHSDKKRLNICRKKQWHTFKVQDVKGKRRASLGLLTGVGSTSLYHHQAWGGETLLRDFEFIGEDKDRQLESL
jgi:hypothetical protein